MRCFPESRRDGMVIFYPPLVPTGLWKTLGSFVLPTFGPYGTTENIWGRCFYPYFVPTGLRKTRGRCFLPTFRLYGHRPKRLVPFICVNAGRAWMFFCSHPISSFLRTFLKMSSSMLLNNPTTPFEPCDWFFLARKAAKPQRKNPPCARLKNLTPHTASRPLPTNRAGGRRRVPVPAPAHSGLTPGGAGRTPRSG